jgi:1-deoxy-D-xylulose-5-phosphate reductoisomerase
MRRVALLGSTGSIGASTLKVARHLPDRVRIVTLAAGSNAAELARQCAEFQPAAAALARSGAWTGVDPAPFPRTERLDGPDGLIACATHPDVDIVLVAIVGTAGLAPALAAVRAGKDLAVASKEILVLAGGIIMAEAARRGVRVLPVDSEHNAIFQCLEGKPASDVHRLILTASGGPFRNTPAADLARVTPEQALRHPTWSMGRKISLDSATMFNKALEMIEAHWLFGVGMDRVDVIVHPQSLVHSMVEFVDGSVLAQVSHTDMTFPIQYALTWPARLPGALPSLDFAKVGSLTFEAPDPARFPALRLAREAGTAGGTLPAVLNAANEIAADAFLAGRIPFPRIWECVERTLAQHTPAADPGLDALLAADSWARGAATRNLSIP